VLNVLAPFALRAFAVRTNNPRSLSAEETAEKLVAAGIPAEPCGSLAEALARTQSSATLICGSLFLAGEALVALGRPPWDGPTRFDVAERLKTKGGNVV